MDWQAALRSHLLQSPPGSICTLDDAARAFAAETLPDTPLTPHGASSAHRCALALGIDVLAGLVAHQARQLIHHVRLYRAPRLLLVAFPDCSLDEAAFLALGFVRLSHDAATGVRLHAFDLDTYKPAPDWLNARFWAHPERWEP